MTHGRVLRAFLWMRWRVFVNSLERTSARDTLERLSIATEKLGPIIALVLLIPSAIGLFVLGIVAGFGVGTGSWTFTMELIRYLLLVALALTLVGPLILPTRDSGSLVRFLLLPIPRFSLYLGQMAGSIADPWILLIVPLMLGISLGLAVGLKFVAALVALLGGLAFVLFLMGITSVAASVVHLLLRDRRRGDMVMLVIVLIIPVVAMAPQFLVKPERQDGRKLTRAERAALPPSRAALVVSAAVPYLPSEMYRRATLNALTAPTSATVPFVSLVLLMAAVQGAAFLAYRRVLDMPVSLGARRAGAFGGLWNRKIPGLSPAASAVAFPQLRLALRTPRGRATIASPLIMPIVLAAVILRAGRSPVPWLDSANGIGLAIFGVVASILALLPLALNQFAIDKAGFTRQMLSPVSIRELLLGKAIGNALIGLMPGICCVLIPLVLFRGGRPGYWVALALAAVGTYLILAPVAAILSALFPKTVDLNSIGNAGNAHQAAGLLGMLTFALATAPAALLAAFAYKGLGRPELVLPFVAGWLLLAIAVSYLLFIPAARFVESRRESLAQYY